MSSTTPHSMNRAGLWYTSCYVTADMITTDIPIWFQHIRNSYDYSMTGDLISATFLPTYEDLFFQYAVEAKQINQSYSWD